MSYLTDIFHYEVLYFTGGTNKSEYRKTNYTYFLRTKLASKYESHDKKLSTKFNPFSTSVPLLNPLKTSSFLMFSGGYRRGTLVENGLMYYQKQGLKLIGIMKLTGK